MGDLSQVSLDEAIYQKYLQPTKRKREPYVGVEFELPIVNLKKRPVDFNVVHRLTAEFINNFAFDTVQRDDNGNIFSASSALNNDILSYDCSYNTLELSFGRETDLNVLYQRFIKYYSFIQSFLEPFNHTLTGMGINPYYKINHNEPIQNGRYRMLFHHLSSYKNYGDAIPFHNSPNFGLFSCASQVQLDVDESILVQALNTFTKLEPLKSLLFANSLLDDDSELLCSRDGLWKNSMHGLNPYNVDMYEVEFTSSKEVMDYIKSMSLYCIERDNKYINFAPIPLEKYFVKKQIVGEYYDKDGYKQICFEPRIEDLKYLRSFKFEDLTYRGTIEFRSVCTQPVRDIMAPAAFHTGLLENLPELTKLLNLDTVIYQKGYSACELRERFNRREFPEFVNKVELSKLLIDVLDIAKQGLLKRLLCEEHFLEPLYQRAKSLCSPAREMAEGLDSGIDMEHYIKEYAKL